MKPSPSTTALLIVALAVPVAAMAANIVQAAKANGHFMMMLKAGDAAGVAGWLQSPGPITLFAPDDAAPAKVPKPMLDDLMKPTQPRSGGRSVGERSSVL